MVNPITRRQLLAFAQGPAGATTRPRLAPREQLVNLLEFEEQAQRALGATAATVVADKRDASGDPVERLAFDRITLRPRMLVPTMDLDLTVTLFGDTLFAPIVVGPIADQKRFHADAEAATVKGAALAKAPVIVSSQSSIPLATLTAGAGTPVWAQVYASDPAAARQLASAAAAGCKMAVLTVGLQPSASGRPARVPIDWTVVGTLVSASPVPVVLKGIATPTDATASLRHNVKGVVVSNFGAAQAPAGSARIVELPAIVDAVGGKVPVLLDGGIRRGTDVVKALALGANAVVVSRPVMWGLAAYGTDGVRSVVEMLQTETARYMAMCGKSSLSMLQRDLVRVHGVAPQAPRPRG